MISAVILFAVVASHRASAESTCPAGDISCLANGPESAEVLLQRVNSNSQTESVFEEKPAPPPPDLPPPENQPASQPVSQLASKPASQPASKAASQLAPDAITKWDAYVSATNAAYEASGGIQEGCVPQRHEPTGGATYRGAVMLMHGFTACPQQFNAMVPKLTEKGFAVFVPLLPGQGAVHTVLEIKEKKNWWCAFGCEMKVVGTEIEDNIDMLPDSKDGYQRFGEEMNGIMAAAGGETVLMGLSVGGAIGMYAGSKFDYTRQFIAVPLVDLPVDSPIMALIRMINFVPGLRSVRTGWGEGCEAERLAGRAGICQFNLRKIMAGRDLGANAFHDHVKAIPAGRAQVVFTEADGAASVSAVQDFAEKFGAGKNTPNSCGFDAAIGHSFLSAFDNPTQNKYWLNEVTDRVVGYLADGTPLAQDGVIESEGSWPRCKVDCTPDDCPWVANGGMTVETPEHLLEEIQIKISSGASLLNIFKNRHH